MDSFSDRLSKNSGVPPKTKVFIIQKIPDLTKAFKYTICKSGIHSQSCRNVFEDMCAGL